MRKVLAVITAMILGSFAAVAIASPASAALPGGPYQIRPYGSNKCMDITGVSYANGAYAQLYDCLGGGQYNQLFFFNLVPGYSDRYQIVAEHSGKCLDIKDVSQLAGARVQQYDCLPYVANQTFQAVYFGSYYWLVPTHSWQEITWQGLFNGASVFQWGGSQAPWVFVHY